VIAGPPRGPIADLDALPPPRRHESPFTSSGVAVAFVAGSRGCVGTCAYCSIRAFAKDMGGPSLRMRSPRSVAEEIAALFRERGASVFYFVDDLFFLPSEKETVERISKIREELERLHTPRLVFCAKARPETMTAAALETAKALGVVHVFLGIENASPERLRYLGRVHTPEDNVRALALCRGAGVRTSFNLMAFDPESTLEDVALNVEFASLFADQPWSLGRTEIHSGTRLLERLREEGRLEGDYRSYGYRMRDDRAEAMFRILRVAFRDRTLAMGSLHNTMTNLSFTRQVHEALFPGKIAADISARVDALMTDVHGDSVMRLRRMIEFCANTDPGDAAQIRAFAVREALEANAAAVPWNDRSKKLLARMNARGEALCGRNPTRTALPACRPSP
jgi:anaerobic magnesium-protoporphyrin IX monomethyl ester cyclase